MTMPLMRYVLLLCVLLLPACGGTLERDDCMAVTLSKHRGEGRAMECRIVTGGEFFVGQQ